MTNERRLDGFVSTEITTNVLVSSLILMGYLILMTWHLILIMKYKVFRFFCLTLKVAIQYANRISIADAYQFT